MIIRIPLTDKNCKITPVFTDSPAPPESGSETFTLPEISFSLSPAPLPDIPAYNFSRYSHPCTEINVGVPEADMPLVKAWLGISPGQAGATPGDTLVKRMTTAVTSAIENYFSATARKSIFTRPFRIAYAMKAADGSLFAVSSPKLLLPMSMAPVMAIREHTLSGEQLSTLTEIVSTPMRLTASSPSFVIPSDIEKYPTHLAIIATRQCDLLSGDETVSGIRSFNVFGQLTPGWAYPRIPEDLIRSKAESDSSFRILAEIPISEAAAGFDKLEVPLPAHDLDDWAHFEIAKGEAGGELNPDSEPVPTHQHIITEPLDLGFPEEYKRVLGVSLRGIFPRSVTDPDSCVTFTLQGSHHRDNWHTIATARGAHIRLLRAVRYRWLRVEIHAPASGIFDALSFEIAK